MLTTTTPTRSELADLAVRCCQVMTDGDLETFHAIVHPEAVNREAHSEPPAAHGRGPEAFHATALWLRSAFSNLTFSIGDVLVDADLTAVHCTMSGRHTGEFVIWNAAGEVERVFAPTGRSFAVHPRTSSASATASPSSTGRCATTRAWPCSSSGCRPRPRSSSGPRSPPDEPASNSAEPAQANAQQELVNPSPRGHPHVRAPRAHRLILTIGFPDSGPPAGPMSGAPALPGAGDWCAG